MDAAEIKKLAAKANGDTWKLLAKPTRSPDENLQMLCCAYSSLYLWQAAGGTPLHLARGHWLISRVLCLLQNSTLAEQHALQCKNFTEQAQDRKDFDVVYAIETQARIAALKGDKTTAQKLKAEAVKLAAAIQDKEDREIAEGDVQSEPWFGIN